MNIKDYKKALRILKSFRILNRWTKEKHILLDQVISLFKKGEYKTFTSNYRIHGRYVGYFYLNNSDHKRLGNLKHFRGSSLIVLCIKRNVGSSREYIAASIDGEIQIPKTDTSKIKLGFQPNLVKTKINISSSKRAP
jgi:hypothetical protein